MNIGTACAPSRRDAAAPDSYGRPSRTRLGRRSERNGDGRARIVVYYCTHLEVLPYREDVARVPVARHRPRLDGADVVLIARHGHDGSEERGHRQGGSGGEEPAVAPPERERVDGVDEEDALLEMRRHRAQETDVVDVVHEGAAAARARVPRPADSDGGDHDETSPVRHLGERLGEHLRGASEAVQREEHPGRHPVGARLEPLAELLGGVQEIVSHAAVVLRRRVRDEPRLISSIIASSV